MEFRKYEKIYRLGKDEVDGILTGQCSITEKVDGANLSIWLKEDGQIGVGSRNREVTKGFNGAVDYCKAHTGINDYLKKNPTHRLYGEWLVKHTLEYSELAYKKFYIFDIRDQENHEYFPESYVQEIANKYDIHSVKDFGIIENPTIKQLKEIIEGKSEIGDKMEGIVVRNQDFVNSFGDKCYGKLVRESFKEENAIAFGGNDKYSDNYWEVYVMNKYITLARVEKIMNKLQPEVDEKLDMKHIPRILGMAYHDMITEEAWSISKKAKTINFDVLQRVCYKKIKQIYVDILNDSISVADKS